MNTIIHEITSFPKCRFFVIKEKDVEVFSKLCSTNAKPSVQISAEIYINLLTYYFDNNNIIETEKEHQLLNAVENHSGLMNTLRSQFRANIHKYADISQWIRDISGNNFYTVLRIFWVISQLVNKLNSMNFIEYSLKRGVLDHSQVEDLLKRGVLDYSTVHEYYSDWVKLEKILGDTFKGINEGYLKYVEEYRKNFKDSLKELYDIEGYLRNKYFREISKIDLISVSAKKEGSNWLIISLLRVHSVRMFSQIRPYCGQI
jgi:hypothetical protein